MDVDWHIKGLVGRRPPLQARASLLSPPTTLPYVLSMYTQRSIALSLLAVAANAAIGPSATLTVSNAQLSPDGYPREYAVSLSFRERHLMHFSVLPLSTVSSPDH